MASERYNTWDPQLAFHVIRSGSISSEELLERTISFRYIDRAKRFDEVRWTLFNGDGELTRLQNMATGLSVLMQFGYAGALTPWRAFVMTALSGSVGVYGKTDPPVRDDASTIELTGRNRNAPAPRTGRNISRTPKMPGQGSGGASKSKNPYPKVKARSSSGRPKSSELGSTSSVTNFEILLHSPSEQRKSFPEAKCVSAAVEIIADLCGFDSDYLLIEDSSTIERSPNGVVIPSGETYGSWIERWARRLGWFYKIDAHGFHFHSKNWGGSGSKKIRDTFSYTAGIDTLDLKIECDFRLPVPSTVIAKGYDPHTRLLHIHNVSAAATGTTGGGGVLAFRNDKSAGASERKANIFNTEILPVGIQEASARAIARFVHRHENAIRLTLTVVGNPRVLAADLIQMSGTGNPLVDATWFVEQAEHDMSGKPREYKTVLTLQNPPKIAASNARVTLAMIANQAAAVTGTSENTAILATRGLTPLRNR